MSLYKRGDWWQSRIVIDGRRFQKALRVKSKTEARQLEAAWRTQIARAEVGLGKAPTISEFSERFLSFLSVHMKASSLNMYQQGWAHVLKFEPLAKARLGDRDLVQRVEQFTKDRRDAGLAVITVNNILRALRRALFLAHEWNLTTREPRKIVKLLPGEHQRDFVMTR